MVLDLLGNLEEGGGNINHAAGKDDIWCDFILILVGAEAREFFSLAQLETRRGWQRRH